MIRRCEAMSAQLPAQGGAQPRVESRIPVFIDQLLLALQSTGDVDVGIVPEAVRHGSELLKAGYSVSEVVEIYGNIGFVVTRLARERQVAVSPAELESIVLCLFTATAEAVSEYQRQRDRLVTTRSTRALNERLGFLAHELRNFLNTAMLAFAAVKSGSVGLAGPTASVIDRSLAGLRDLIEQALADVRHSAEPQMEILTLVDFMAGVVAGANLAASDRDCVLEVSTIDPDLAVRADRHLLHSAVENLLQNAFKFTHPHTCVNLQVTGTLGRVLIEVADECGGLPAGKTEALFLSFTQRHADRSGLGLGLSISRQAVEAMGGNLRVRDLPGKGCVFTIDLPRVVAAIPADTPSPQPSLEEGQRVA
ncbi:MAG TPA: HAMP domain-containing sensor histidine kinase [Usitatibacter sp.]|nr:HAMP domain-containing sensor histidine kinase [Usitatibacter sp.]